MAKKITKKEQDLLIAALNNKPTLATMLGKLLGIGITIFFLLIVLAGIKWAWGLLI